MNYILKDLYKCQSIHKKLIRLAKEEKENLLKTVGPAEYSNGTSYLDADCIHGSRKEMCIQEIIEQSGRLENMIYLENCILEKTEKEIKKIKKGLKGLEGLELKVREMRTIEGKKLNQIANELGYSEGYIRRVACKTSNT